MLVLGVNSGFNLMDQDATAGHDAAAVLLSDGAIVAAVEEERLTRVKHTSAFPIKGIRYCVQEAGVSLDAIDSIAINGLEAGLDLQVYTRFLKEPSVPWRLGAREFISALFRDSFGVEVGPRLRFCEHHVAHAWSAFGCSGFDESLVVTLDGAGDNNSGTVFVGRHSTLDPQDRYAVPESLGMMYLFMTRLIGYGAFDEYKVMGLAPHGDPRRFYPLFRSLYVLLEGGRYRFENASRVIQRLIDAGILESARRRGQEFQPIHADIAAALQQSLEEIVLHVIAHHQRVTNQEYLCLAGGVAHNCSMVGRISRTGWFRDVYVQPASHDGGGALGAALWVWNNQPRNRPKAALVHAYLGPHVASSSEEVCTQLTRWAPAISFRREGEVARASARLLADGHVIGWVQGRSEFGPRALGNRSILADPRPVSNRQRINAIIKKREAYRPFAPVIRDDAFPTYFDGGGRRDFRFMTCVVLVRESKRELLGAVTHVDGTARVQTVSLNTNPLFYDLLAEVERLIGVPILLNTSFNNHAEPLVQSTDDAVACFLTSGLDFLVAGDYIVSKPSREAILSTLQRLAPSVAENWHLCVDSGRNPAIELKHAPQGGSRYCQITNSVFRVLEQSDGQRTLSELRSGMAPISVLTDLFELWTERAIAFRPPEGRQHS